MAETLKREFTGPSVDDNPAVTQLKPPTTPPVGQEETPSEAEVLLEKLDVVAATPRPVPQTERAPVAPRGVPGRPTLRQAPTKEVTIGLDTSITVILSLDSEGKLLNFDDSPEGFQDLEEAVLDAMSRENRLRYLVAAGTHARLLKELKDPEARQTAGLNVLGAHAPATERLAVEGKRKGMSYLWPLASEVRVKEREGYKVCTDPSVKTFVDGPGTSKTVGIHGDAEHVLMEKPEGEVLKHLHEIGRKSRARALGAEEATRRDIIASGGIPLDVEDQRRGRNWSRAGGPAPLEE